VPSAREAFKRLMETARSAPRYRDLLLVFLCGVCYQAGVATVIALAAIYAEQVMGFKTRDTIMLILVVNVTAAIGAFGFGYAQDRVGKVVALRMTIVGWIAMTVVAYFSRTPGMFWVAANLAGFCMGSSQSAGRALVAYLSPEGRSAEFFGLWGVAVRLAAILGPLTYGIVTWVTGGNHRLAILLCASSSSPPCWSRVRRRTARPRPGRINGVCPIVLPAVFLSHRAPTLAVEDGSDTRDGAARDLPSRRRSW
jgi:UMF1 family MFS transporter